jgi:type I restriction enzyme S subunit
LGEVYDVRDGTHDSPRYQSEGYPLITSKNLKNGVITFDKVKYISANGLYKYM